MMASSPSGTLGFAQLRSLARQHEAQLGNLFGQLSVVARDPEPQPSPEEEALTRQIDELLSKNETTLHTMGQVVQNDSQASSSATKLHHVQRHRELLAQHQKEYQRLKNTIQQERNRLDLMSSVRRDVDAYRAGEAGGSGRPREEQEAEYMLEERSRLDSSHSMADSILAQAYETREEFYRQRTILSNVQRRMLQSVGQIPGINTLIKKINVRRRRDFVIIVGVISLCLLALWFLG